MKYVGVVLVVVCSYSALASPSSAEPNQEHTVVAQVGATVIAGTIGDAVSDASISGAVVELLRREAVWSADGMMHLRPLEFQRKAEAVTTTDGGGRFELVTSSSEEPAYYALRIKATGYDDVWVMIVHATRDGGEPLSVHLLPEHLTEAQINLLEEKRLQERVNRASEDSDLAAPPPASQYDAFAGIPAHAVTSLAVSAFTVPDEVQVRGLPVNGYSCGSGTPFMMDFDEFVMGAVSKELGDGFPLETLKAQAVAVRSFALEQSLRGIPGNCGMAYTSTVTTKSRNATLNTTKSVVLYNGNVIRAWFSARCNGDKTLNSENSLGGSCAAPCSATKPAPCGQTNGSVIGYARARNCTHHDYTNCDSSGETPCCHFFIEGRNQAIYGHGLGLCQRGAQNLGGYVAGQDWRSILNAYYTSVSIVNDQAMVIGSSVRVTSSGVNVRDSACGTPVATVNTGDAGVVVDGPQRPFCSGKISGTNYLTWWKVSLSGQTARWIAEDFLEVTGAAALKPVITSFEVSPRSITTGGHVTATITATDGSNGGLQQLELWRAPDNGGVPGTWGRVASTSATGQGPYTVTVDDHPPSAGVFWYGAHATNANGWSPEPSPPGPLQVTVGQACISFSISPLSSSPDASAGQRTVTITGSPAGCQGGNWTAAGNGSWLTVSPSSGSGSSTTKVSWQQNTLLSSRAGTAMVAGNMYSVTQAGLCAPPAPPVLTAPAAAARGSNYDVSWSATSPEGYYSLQESLDSAFSPTQIIHGSNGYLGTSSTFVHSPSATTTYYYRVQARNRCSGNDLWSDYSIVKSTIVSGNIVRRVRGDFNGDLISDIFWRNNATGENSVWYVNGGLFNGGATAPYVPANAESIIGVGDFNNDGKADLLWRNTATGVVSVWFMNGGTIIGGRTLATLGSSAVFVGGVGDFNHDGYADIFWRDPNTGANSIWYLTAGGFQGGASMPALSNPNFTAFISDFNNDGYADVLWRNLSTGENYIWLMNGGQIIGGSQLPTVVGTSLIGTGDFNGDGVADLLWRNFVSGANYVWFIANGAFSTGGQLPTVNSTAASMVGIGDFDGDAKDDLLWRTPTTGATSVWLLNGAVFKGGTTLPSVIGTQFQVISPK